MNWHYFSTYQNSRLTFVLLSPDLSLSDNTVDPDQLASDKAIRSGPTLFSTLIGYNRAVEQAKIEECST